MRSSIMKILFFTVVILFILSCIFHGWQINEIEKIIGKISFILFLVTAALFLHLLSWQKSWQKAIREGNYSRAQNIAEKKMRFPLIWKSAKRMQIIALLMGGSIEETIICADLLLQGKTDSRKWMSPLAMKNTALFLQSQYAEVIPIEKEMMIKEWGKYSINEMVQEMITAAIAGDQDTALAQAGKLRYPVPFYICLTAVVQCEIYNQRGDALRAAFYSRKRWRRQRHRKSMIWS